MGSEVNGSCSSDLKGEGPSTGTVFHVCIGNEEKT